MKKHLISLLTLLLILSGCSTPVQEKELPGVDAVVAEEGPVLLSNAATEVNVTHDSCEGSETVTLAGEELSVLRDWANGLELIPCGGDFPEGESPDEVEGGECWTIKPTDGNSSGFRYRNNGPDDCYVTLENEWFSVLNPSDPPVAIPEEEISAEPHWDLIPMVRVDGVLYYDAGERNDDAPRCGVMDGEITSAVEGWEIPQEDNQSNFGSGYGWQWGSSEGYIEVQVDDHWIVFESEKLTRSEESTG